MLRRAIISSNYYGDTKLVLLPLRFKSYYRDVKKFKDNELKLNNSISRAKSKVLDYVMNNDFKYFVTLTLNDNLNSYNLGQISNFFSQRIRDIRKKYKIDFKYVFIPEKHVKGDYHLHGFVSGDIEKLFYKNDYGYNSIKEFDFAGYQNYSTIRNYKACSKYVLKYITKDMAEIGKGKHLYFCSKGLNTSSRCIDFVVANYNELVDFNSEYVDIKYNLNDSDIDKLYSCYYNNYN